MLIAANRDEMAGRPWQPPARHWAERPSVTAGRDMEAGGTWLGTNDAGVVAAVLNRVGSLGPAGGKRTRGDLPLIALDRQSAHEAAEAIVALPGKDFRAFNVVIADAAGAFWLRWTDRDGARNPEMAPIPQGLHMLTAHDLDDAEASPRVARHLPLFRAAPAPDPDAGDWAGWQARLADPSRDSSATESGSLLIEDRGGFGTVSSSLIALAGATRRTIWMFAAGRPDKVSFRPVALDTTDCV
jgi:hypothetical protein